MTGEQLIEVAFGSVGAGLLIAWAELRLLPLLREPLAHLRAQSEQAGIKREDLERHGWKPHASGTGRGAR